MDQLVLRRARQVQVAHEHVARVETSAVVVPLTGFTIAFIAPIVITRARVVVEGVVADPDRSQPTTQLEPLLLAILNPIVALA